MRGASDTLYGLNKEARLPSPPVQRAQGALYRILFPGQISLSRDYTQTLYKSMFEPYDTRGGVSSLQRLPISNLFTNPMVVFRYLESLLVEYFSWVVFYLLM